MFCATNEAEHVCVATLFTAVFLDHFDACLALDLTAPMEFAIAPFFNDDLLSVVAAAAAQNGAAIQAR